MHQAALFGQVEYQFPPDTFIKNAVFWCRTMHFLVVSCARPYIKKIQTLRVALSAGCKRKMGGAYCIINLRAEILQYRPKMLFSGRLPKCSRREPINAKFHSHFLELYYRLYIILHGCSLKELDNIRSAAAESVDSSKWAILCQKC